MQNSLAVVYANILDVLKNERDKLTDQDFESGSACCGLYIILLYSSFEFFISRCFERLIDIKMQDCDAKKKIKNDLTSNKINYDLYCSLLLQDCYEKSTVLQTLLNKRHQYAHGGMLSKSGSLKKEGFTSKEQLEEFLCCVTSNMEKIMNEVMTLQNEVI